MKKQYECLLIIKGTLSEEEKQKAIKQIEKIFAKFKIKTLEKIDWGQLSKLKKYLLSSKFREDRLGKKKFGLPFLSSLGF